MKTKGRPDYIRLGRSKGLSFIDTKTPSTIRKKSHWRCRRCGLEHHKSYIAVRDGEYGCRCQNELTLNEEQYYKLANDLQIQYAPQDFIPRNNKQKVRWIGRNGKEVMASYHELAYGHISKRLVKALALTGTASQNS